MAIQDHLLSGEVILSKHEPFYATSLRVIRYQHSGPREEFYELPYTRLTGVELVKRPRHPVMLGGTLLAILGMLLGVIGLVISAFIAFVAGVGLVFYGAAGRPAYYQLHARGMSREELARWQVDCTAARGFIATVRERIGQLPDF